MNKTIKNKDYQENLLFTSPGEIPICQVKRATLEKQNFRYFRDIILFIFNGDHLLV